MFNNEQLKGMFERLATITATWFLLKMVQKGFISSEDSGVLLPGLVVILVAAPSLAYGWWVNRSKALQQAASNTVNPDGTKPIIVTSDDIAAATKESNIVSASTNKVVTDVETEVVLQPGTVVQPPMETKT